MPSQGNCPVCENGKTALLLEIPNAPVFCNQICASRDEALAAPLASIELSFCGNCGHLFNSVFAPEKMDYNPDYENSLHFSPRFQAYADDLAAGLIRRYGLRDKLILEIGCGQGDFLKALCSMAPNRGLGFDPGYQGARDPDPAGSCVTILPEGFSETRASRDAALICCRHCLEHIARPIPFLEMVRKAAGEDAKVPVFFEVPNVLYTLRDGGIWDILYEHCGYFSPASLTRAFTRAGFQVEEVAETFDGQFLTLHGRPANGPGPGPGPDPPAASLEGLVAEFSSLYRDKVELWKTRLERWKRDGKKVVVWGAGTKGTMFLNTLGRSGAVQQVVDVNPRKHGRFVAGTGQVIIPPQDLAADPPQVILVMNPIYRAEIGESVRKIGLEVEFSHV